MLSTRLGYRRPAFFARALAHRKVSGVSFVRAFFFLGFGLSQGLVPRVAIAHQTRVP
jgi:hypothetical protein